ncbi:hypothetical protein Bca52824_046634 [Brassica carinata]|uniref:Uncharacterized protein n=1 Tax=Brassica carinata TaxID=52824 RepID=A0A8X7REZ6_BRACI|nr:hypothetical protein Bca52824_046634 [Brassica carinata]
MVVAGINMDGGVPVIGMGETMRVMYDPWFANNKVDVFFSSQVHAYERPLKDQSAPVYITIADGGNIEGFALYNKGLMIIANNLFD